MSVYTLVCAHAHTSLQFIVWIWLKWSRRLQVWGPALGQLDLRLLLVWFPSGGHRLKIQEIQEELRFRFESRGRKHGCPGSKAGRVPLFVGKSELFCLDLQLIGWGSWHWRGQPPFLRPLFQKPVSPKTPNAPTDTSRIKCDQVTGNSITLTHRINIAVCVLVCLFKILRAPRSCLLCNSP